MRARWAGFIAALAIIASGLSPALAASGTDPQPNVVGGVGTDIGNVPWQVALVDSSAGTDFHGQFCGGSIVAPRWVVTAAHCIEPGGGYPRRTPGNFVVLAGKSVLSDVSETSGPYTGVAEVFTHEMWGQGNGLYDIALVHLATPLAFNSAISPIALPTAQDRFKWPAAGTPALISGWGFTKEGVDSSAPQQLQKAMVTVLDGPARAVDPCSTLPLNIDPSQICAGYLEGGVDTCQGDSGGPLVVDAGVPVLAGITSQGFGCARAQSPGIYTRVTSFLDWIVPFIGKDSGLWVNTSGLAFPNQPLGSAWAAQSITIINSGVNPLDGVSASLAGANPGAFTLGSTCPSSLPSGGSCAVTVGFQPATSGDSQAGVSIQPGGLMVGLSGSASVPVTPTPPPPPIPAKPTGVKAKAKKKSVRVGWNAVPGATEYVARLNGRDAKKPKKKIKVTVRTANTSVVIRKAVLRGATFRVCVSAANSSGASAATCVQSMRTR